MKPKNAPLISVVLPTYNRAEVVGRAIRSVLRQTYPNFELIVADDGSTDGTDDVINSFSDDRIVYIKNQRRKGVSKVRNQGLYRAKGEYISFIDSDDEWLPEKLEIQVKVLEELDNFYGVVYCSGWSIFRDKVKPLSYKDLGSGDLSRKILNKWPSLETTLIRRNYFIKSGFFDPEIDCGEDIDLWIRLAQLCRFYYIDRPLVIVHNSENGISRNWSLDMDGRIRRIKKYANIYRDNPMSLHQEYLYIALCYASLGSVENCRKYLTKGIKAYPLGLKCYLAYFASLFGINALRQIAKITGELKYRIPSTAI